MSRSPRPVGPTVSVHARSEDGGTVWRAPLPHGQHPEHVLREAGLPAVRAVGVTTIRDPHVLELDYEVVAGEGAPPRAARRVSHDVDLVLAPGEEPLQVQRCAAYALVVTARGVLLTRFSARTNVEGQWGLPGGGIDPGETPVETIARETAEETGQRIVVGDYLGCVDGHWVGRAPDGEAQDFHAVRLVYRAQCPDPSDPVVHDVGGTTEASRWVPVEQIADLPVVTTWRHLLAALD